MYVDFGNFEILGTFGCREREIQFTIRVFKTFPFVKIS
jgi:hypothetical protein